MKTTTLNTTTFKKFTISSTALQLKQLPVNFCKCGITGWCLEVLFTSAESIMRHDWRLMGRTSFDVPHLRMRSASGTDRQMDRRLAQSGEITERKKVGSGGPPRYALYGPDFCGGIRLRSVASVTGNVSLGLHGTEYEYRRPHTARFCSAVVRHRAFI